MHIFLYLFSLFLISSNVIVVQSDNVSSFQPSCRDYERVALLQFKNHFHVDCSISANPQNIIPRAKVKSWVEGRSGNCCSWDGVECNKKTGHVIGLNLTASCLYGTFPQNSTIFNLAYLRKLVLSYNDFNFSQIPPGIGQLSELRILRLLDSTFSGQIPVEISALSKLSVLQLGDDIKGTLLLKLQNPSLARLVQNLTRLQELFLLNVDVSSPMPFILQNITTLKHIRLVKCNLRGKLPPDLFRLPHLEILELSTNEDCSGSAPEFQWDSPLKVLSLVGISLYGELPPSIGKLAHLNELTLLGCKFYGSIPASLGNLTNLAHLYLADNDFSGVIPHSISNLTNLESLFIADLNLMPGQLISNFPKLPKLKILGLGGMKLGSTIPLSFSANLKGLTDLYLTGTHLVGPIPPSFANLTQLEVLSLAGNQLEGPIPQWFTRLINLRMLTLPDNKLSANFEIFSRLENLHFLNLAGIGVTFSPGFDTNPSLFKLKFLRLESCNLTEFPAFLRGQNELEHLLLGENHITGSIPQWFVNATKESLLTFDLSNNNLTGFEQPVTVLPWTRLQVFDVGGNNFQGELPIPPVSITGYDVSNNTFTGVVPKKICMARSPIKLDLSNNNLSSQPIPQCIGDQLGNSLQLLNLRGNNFHGGIPRSFTTYCNLKMINLSDNELHGDLPRSLANCTMLEVLDLGKNRINDSFPYWLGSLPHLQVVVLRHNNFHGSISDQEFGPQFSQMRIIDVSHNFFIGNLPSRYLRNWGNMMVVKEDKSSSYSTEIDYVVMYRDGKAYTHTGNFEYSMTITSKGSERLYSKILEVFRVVDFSSNNFSGKIPDVIGELKGLQALNLSNNNLDGEIPASVANMTDLESLDLSRNMLYGVIPPALTQLTYLEVFDVSYNNLEGPIPRGNQFNTFENSSFVGNSRLCGGPLSRKCHMNDAPASQMTDDPSNDNSELIDWIVRSSGCVSGFIIGVVIGKLYVTDKYHEWFMETFQRRPRRKVKRVARHQRRR